MKKTLSFLLTLVMCVSIMPTIASASSETGRMQDEYDPETGYTTITTDDYIAVVPKGGIVEYSSDNKNLCADEVLKTTTYSNEDSIVPFDYQATVREMYEYVLKTNADMDPSSAMEIAQKLAANIEAARNASIYGNMRGITSYVTETGATVVDLGCIQDGKLVPSDALRYVPDSRTRIISEGWSVNPHVDSSVLNCRYVVPWNGLDLYKSSDSGSMTFSSEISTSQTVGFSASGGINAYDAVEFGLTVTGSQTVTAKISKGYTLNVSAWKKHMLRPYIYYYVDTYKGTYRYYCHNFFDDHYFYVYEDRSAVNKYDIEHGVRSWVRENTAHNPNATSPIPPTNWEW